MENNNLTELTKIHKGISDYVGVVQLSDLHFNELIYDIDQNRFDFEVASKRIRKLITRAIMFFKSHYIKDVALFLTGDLLNSDRRLDEITSASDNRSRAIFLAVDILQQAILDLNSEFNIVVASVTGNESRVGQFVNWTNLLASDSYDIVIHNMLSYLFRDSEGVRFIDIRNPLECVVNVNGSNFLLVHGHGHKGLSRTQNIEIEVEKIKSRYSTKGVPIRYVVCGHIHQAYVSDLFSRSGGLPGNNAYSERGLNLQGRSSQNIYIVDNKGSIDGIKIDLQDIDDWDGYEFDNKLQSYHNKDNPNSTVVIQSVLI